MENKLIELRVRPEVNLKDLNDYCNNNRVCATFEAGIPFLQLITIETMEE